MLIMMDFIIDPTHSLSGLLAAIIEEVGANEKREHEHRMKELELISNSGLRDVYVQQLMLNRLLYPVEQAQHEIHNSAKHAQWLSEMIVYHHAHHGMEMLTARELSRELKLLAIQIANANTLHELKLAYAIATLFNDKAFVFMHPDPKFSIHKEIREGILNRLNTCIATAKNFEMRRDLLGLLPVDSRQHAEHP